MIRRGKTRRGRSSLRMQRSSRRETPLPETTLEPPPAGDSPEVASREELLQGMSFLQHLEELRKRLIWSLLGIALGFGVCWLYVERIFGWMQRPIVNALQRHKLDTQLVYTSP